MNIFGCAHEYIKDCAAAYKLMLKSPGHPAFSLEDFKKLEYLVSRSRYLVSNLDEQYKLYKLIWDRFPKFVLGFILVSILYSFVISADTLHQTKDLLKGIQTTLFAFAFVGIGLETDFSVLVKTGNGRPAIAFVIAQIFNILFTLLLAWLLFAHIG